MLKVNKSERIRKLYDEGKSIKQIKAKVKCSHALIAVVLRNYRKKLRKLEIVKTAKETKQAMDVIQKSKKDPKAVAWAKRNPWFGVSKPRTAYALGLHEELIQSGVDPESDEYYKKIDEGMSIFPSGKKKKPKITRKELLKELLPGIDACFGLEKKPTKLIVRPEHKDAALKLLDMKEADPVNHPPHYKTGGVETIDFIEAKDLNYRLGNVVKYVSRAGKKGDPIQDLEKAAWYLQREITARKNA